MFDVQQTEQFEAWFEGLRDHVARKRIGQRIARLEIGLFGDTRNLGDKVSELRIDHGPGYRVYYTRTGETILLLLLGGDKGSQDPDIARAKEMAARLG